MSNLVIIRADFLPNAKELGIRAHEASLLARRGLEPFLALLEFNEWLRLNLIVSPTLLLLLAKETTARLKKLAVAGQLELIMELASAPAPEIMVPGSWKRHLDYSLRLWQQTELPGVKGVWSPDGWIEDLAALLPDKGISTLLCPTSSNSKTPPTIVSLTSGSCLLLPVGSSCSLTDLKNLTDFKTTLGSPPPGESTQLPEITVISISTNELLPDESNSALRHLLVESLPQYRGERAKITVCLSLLSDPNYLSSAAFVQVGAKNLPIGYRHPEVLQLPNKLQHLKHRIAELDQIVATLPQKITQMPNQAANEPRVIEAEAMILEAQHRAIITAAAPNASNRARQFALNRLIRCQVEVDTILNPEVDPVIGWAKATPPTANYPNAVIDTQLQHLTLSTRALGALIGWEHKPRKHDFSNTFGGSQSILSGIDLSLELTTPLELTAISSQVASQLSALEADIASGNTQSSCQILVTRQTLDVAGLKVEFPLAQTPKTKIVKHYLFKAGIGAHLNNATTGFSIESWLESPEKPLPKSYIASIVCLTLPAAAIATTSARLLSAFGGTSDKAISLTEAKLFRNQDSEGGLHGLRVIDGIDGLFVDIRSAKPLDACLIEPLEHDPLNPELFGGLRISFILAAQRIFEDIKSNTVFFSIR